MAAVKEAIEIGEKANIPVEIAHLKARGKPVWGKSVEILDLVKQARARGIDVTFDQYPYTASATSLVGSIVPRRAVAGGEAKMKERLLDPLIKDRVKREMQVSIEKRGGPEKLFIATFQPDAGLEGKHLAEIGKMKGKEPVDAAIDILVAGGADVVSFNMLEEDVICPGPPCGPRGPRSDQGRHDCGYNRVQSRHGHGQSNLSKTTPISSRHRLRHREWTTRLVKG